MGGVVSSMKSSDSKNRAELAMLAMQQEQAFANVQQTYSELQSAMAATITEFVTMHCILSSDQTKEVHNEEQDSCSVEKTSRRGERGEASHENKGFTSEALEQIKVQFEEINISSTALCKLLETKSDQVQVVKEHKNYNLVRSFTRSLSTRTKIILSRSRSSKVGDDGGQKAEAAASTVQRLYAREKQLSKELKRVELQTTMGGEVDKQFSQEDAEEAFVKIKRIRDDELQPQLCNLLRSLHGNWKSMSECHAKQHNLMPKETLCKPQDQMCNDADSLRATDSLQIEFENWRAAFTSCVRFQKAYIKSLYEWSKSNYSLPSFFGKEENHSGCETLLGDWLGCLEKLDDEEMTKAMDAFEAEVKNLRKQQKTEQQCKVKFEKLKNDIFILVSQKKAKKKKTKKEEAQAETLSQKKDKKSKKEKDLENALADYKASKGSTQENVKNVITGFASVFNSLAGFTKTAAEKYAEVAGKHNIAVEGLIS